MSQFHPLPGGGFYAGVAELDAQIAQLRAQQAAQAEQVGTKLTRLQTGTKLVGAGTAATMALPPPFNVIAGALGTGTGLVLGIRSQRNAQYAQLLSGDMSLIAPFVSKVQGMTSQERKATAKKLLRKYKAFLETGSTRQFLIGRTESKKIRWKSKKAVYELKLMALLEAERNAHLMSEQQHMAQVAEAQRQAQMRKIVPILVGFVLLGALAYTRKAQ